MKIKKLFKIFPSVEKIRIIDNITFKELYSGDMGHLSGELLEFPIDCVRSAIDLKENKPMLYVYVRKAEE
ncbi:Uncharacterised protein [Chlamydia trachomatis]|nr:Uncharacterised protein [Chlamydia trachomatis]